MDSKRTGHERVPTPWKAVATVALVLAAALALTACGYGLPLVSEFKDGCKKLSNRDVIRVSGAGAKVDGFNYSPQPSVAPDPGTDRNVLAGGDICARYVSGWKDGDRRGNSMVYARTQTGSDAPAVFRRERETALNRDTQDAQTLRTFFLSDTHPATKRSALSPRTPTTPLTACWYVSATRWHTSMFPLSAT
ncbi:hypothetical protein [Nocardia sp. NPDC058633]|uniref:hypothetical protein n=1 Tax=Nocardia sp. NPDC058633 TaxID=3346568 RepID=UPI003662161A